MKSRSLATAAEAERLESQLDKAAERAVLAARDLIERSDSPLAVLAELKFRPVGRDPLDAERPLNFIEQLNQTFTYLASFRAAAQLLREHPSHAPLSVNLGTASGTDIESQDGRVAAEVFASVDPRNNNKLKSDLKRILKHTAEFRYVFYLSPARFPREAELETNGVQIRWLPVDSRAA